LLSPLGGGSCADLGRGALADSELVENLHAHGRLLLSDEDWLEEFVDWRGDSVDGHVRPVSEDLVDDKTFHLARER